jgi:hypothetical protein
VLFNPGSAQDIIVPAGYKVEVTTASLRQYGQRRTYVPSGEGNGASMRLALSSSYS